LSWFVCVIGKSRLGNWDLCKKVGAYGVSLGRGRPNIKEEDRVLIWLGGRGYVAEAVVTGPPTIPHTQEEVPWPGGLRCFAYVLPINVVAEVREPIYFPFVGRVQPETGVKTAQLQRGVSLISDSGAMKISAAIRKQVIAEEQAQDVQNG
jgi:hypothetical protein